MEPTGAIPAAQYVRMSTDDQQCSIPTQKEAIEKYASEHGYSVVATYADEGRSGVGIKSRLALRQLLKDVVGGNAHFKTILVYDVSRWGRFQDADEAAHYEFLCKAAGIPVQYCAEQFINDTTVPSSLMKALKRVMAAEYSRELGVKVLAGQVRLARMGFRVAGEAGPGLRRMMVTLSGQRKMVLETGEHKAIKTDHVILVPGPKREGSIVREIFRLAANRRNTPRKIARELNRRKLWIDNYERWDGENIWRILKNEKYKGYNVFGKTTRKLGMPTHTLPRDKWVVVPDAFAAIVDPAIFDKAQEWIRSRSHAVRKPDEFYLRILKRVLARHGRITEKLLPVRADCFTRRFGSLRNAYQLVGYEPSPHAFKSVANQAKVKSLRSGVLAELRKLFPENLRFVHLPGQTNRQVLEFDHHVRVALHICGQVRKTVVSGEPRWLLKAQPLELGYPALICLPDVSLNRILRYYLVPQFGGIIGRYKVLKLSHKWFAAGQEIEKLSDLRGAAILMAGDWQQKDDSITFGDVVITVRSSTIKMGGKEISLPPVQAELFKMLVRSAGCVVPRAVMKHPFAGSEFPSAHLNAHMCELRRRLGSQFRRRIQTIPGLGYRYAVRIESDLKLAA